MKKHIRQTHQELQTQAWCGKHIEPFEWAFLDIDHAINTIKTDDEMQWDICKRCLAAIEQEINKVYT